MRQANITDNVQVIAKAKVPIIKFVTGPGASIYIYISSVLLVHGR